MANIESNLHAALNGWEPPLKSTSGEPLLHLVCNDARHYIVESSTSTGSTECRGAYGSGHILSKP